MLLYDISLRRGLAADLLCIFYTLFNLFGFDLNFLCSSLLNLSLNQLVMRSAVSSHCSAAGVTDVIHCIAHSELARALK